MEALMCKHFKENENANLLCGSQTASNFRNRYTSGATETEKLKVFYIDSSASVLRRSYFFYCYLPFRDYFLLAPLLALSSCWPHRLVHWWNFAIALRYTPPNSHVWDVLAQCQTISSFFLTMKRKCVIGLMVKGFSLVAHLGNMICWEFLIEEEADEIWCRKNKVDTNEDASWTWFFLSLSRRGSHNYDEINLSEVQILALILIMEWFIRMYRVWIIGLFLPHKGFEMPVAHQALQIKTFYQSAVHL